MVEDAIWPQEQWMYLPSIDGSDFPGPSVLFCICGWCPHIPCFSSWTCAKCPWSPPPPWTQLQPCFMHDCSSYGWITWYESIRIRLLSTIQTHTDHLHLSPVLQTREVYSISWEFWDFLQNVHQGDASLLQQEVASSWAPLAFYSKKLSAPETRYSAFDCEMFAANSSLRKFPFHVRR